MSSQSLAPKLKFKGKWQQRSWTFTSRMARNGQSNCHVMDTTLESICNASKGSAKMLSLTNGWLLTVNLAGALPHCGIPIAALLCLKMASSHASVTCTRKPIFWPFHSTLEQLGLSLSRRGNSVLSTWLQLNTTAVMH